MGITPFELSPVNSAQHYAFRKTYFQDQEGKDVVPEYDFIVVGGGASGCVVASRLSEIEGVSVLLVEQGTTLHQHPELQTSVAIPLQARSLHASSFDSAFKVETKDQFAEKQITANVGKVLGGSTCINWAIWTRGPKVDYDLWAKLVDDEGYSWDSMLPIFKEIETFTPPKHDGPYLTSPSHGYSGPITVRPVSASPRYPPGQRSKWSPLAQASYEHVGFKKIRAVGAEGEDKVESLDVNTGEMIGYGEIQESVGVDGMRSTANEFLKRAKLSLAPGKPGLTIWTAVHVNKLTFTTAEGDEPRVSGIDTNVGFVKARKEVILTAGGIQTPHLLLLSGIGPVEHLKEAGVDVVKANEEVGTNLWEHPIVDIAFKLKNEHRGGTAEDLNSVRTAGPYLNEWAHGRTGFMSGVPFEWIGFTNLKHALDAKVDDQVNLDSVKQQHLLRSLSPHIEHFLHYGHGLISAPDPMVSSYLAITAVLLQPASRGSIRIAIPTITPESSSSLPAYLKIKQGPARPEVTLNQLHDPLDKEMMRLAVEKSYDILSSPALKEFVEAKEKPDSEGILEVLKEKMSTLWHYGGTCTMRTAHTPGVVDTKMRVQGVKGLRVADTSVMPFPLAGHTQALAYAIGEKAAQFVKEAYA